MFICNITVKANSVYCDKCTGGSMHIITMPCMYSIKIGISTTESFLIKQGKIFVVKTRRWYTRRDGNNLIICGSIIPMFQMIC